MQLSREGKGFKLGDSVPRPPVGHSATPQRRLAACGLANNTGNGCLKGGAHLCSRSPLTVTSVPGPWLPLLFKVKVPHPFNGRALRLRGGQWSRLQGRNSAAFTNAFEDQSFSNSKDQVPYRLTLFIWLLLKGWCAEPLDRQVGSATIAEAFC